MPYRSPVADFRFILDHVVPLAPVAGTSRFAEATPETVEAILTEAARMCDEVLAPLNRAGDLTPARLENGVVRSSPGFAEGFGAIAEGGWVALAADPEYGGMGLPQTLNIVLNDMMSAACMALQLNPLLTQGQIEALEHHGSDEIKATYLPRLISGEWSGTMNLTEPQAGSDVGALRSKAEPKGDGSYAITGQKIFITWGDCDFVGNVCHLVLARLPDGGPGTRGISLFMVPKFIPDADGNPGVANSLKVVSIEHKMGLHGSPTCVMSFEGATGWLVGEPHKGMAAMFTMMNNARLAVGVQGVGVAEAAYQMAAEYARDRAQMGAIIDHADVRRMLATMKAEVFAARSIALACAVSLDMGRATGDADWQARAALLTPIAKAYGSDTGMAVSETCVQVHGGMGFVEETGAGQFWRDARITPIYEGTNGVQAADLVGRKMPVRAGASFMEFIAEMKADLPRLQAAGEALAPVASGLERALADLERATGWMLRTGAGGDAAAVLAGSVAYQRLWAITVGAWRLALAALAEDEGQDQRVALARYFVTRRLPETGALLAEATAGAVDLYAVAL
ncbi:MAG: acyl-CoA dehydrogenase family protein [Rhodobacteraceae bacterium]|nr:acyl-CoA dehydrogenase family protein [Paracoccaceae bacterium]